MTLFSPNGGETGSDRLSLAWRDSDTDGNALFYTVQCSPDDGANWYILCMDFADMSYDGAVQDLLVASDESDATFTAKGCLPYSPRWSE